MKRLKKDENILKNQKVQTLFTYKLTVTDHEKELNFFLGVDGL